MAYDYDPGLLGQITYTVSDNHFTVVPIGASGGIIQVAK